MCQLLHNLYRIGPLGIARILLTVDIAPMLRRGAHHHQPQMLDLSGRWSRIAHPPLSGILHIAIMSVAIGIHRYYSVAEA